MSINLSLVLISVLARCHCWVTVEHWTLTKQHTWRDVTMTTRWADDVIVTQWPSDPFVDGRQWRWWWWRRRRCRVIRCSSVLTHCHSLLTRQWPWPWPWPWQRPRHCTEHVNQIDPHKPWKVRLSTLRTESFRDVMNDVTGLERRLWALNLFNSLNLPLSTIRSYHRLPWHTSDSKSYQFLVKWFRRTYTHKRTDPN